MHARLCTIVPQVRSAFLRLDSSSHRRLLGNSAAQVKKQVRIRERKMAFGPTDKQLEKVQKDLGYEFTDKWLLRQAFLHPSAGEFNNYRLSWMGDAAMQLVVSQLVFASSTGETTEILNDRRKVMVMREFCAEVQAAGCKKLEWHKMATVGKCFAKKEEEVTCNMQAELFEAIWGALFIDARGDYKVLLDAYTKNFPLHELEPIFSAIDENKKRDIEAREIAKRLAKKRPKTAEVTNGATPSSKAEESSKMEEK